MMGRPTFVAVVDDDESVRESLPDLLGQLGYATRAFASAEEFLASGSIADTQCMILDVTLPGISGPELMQALNLQGRRFPIIFITAQGDKSIRCRLIKLGAVECLFKPFSDQNLQGALKLAFSKT